MLTYKYYLTISLAILVSFIVLAAIISPRISDNDDIFSAIIEGDKMTYLQVNNPHFEPLNQIMLLFSQYGRGVAWTLTGVLLFIFGGWTGRKTAIVMAITMLILIPIGTIAKETVRRVRPAMPETELLMAPDTGYSFPSGHAVIASSGAALMLALYRGSYKKLAVSIGLAAEAALVCFSRVYVGDHYPLDIAGGILLGVGVAFIFISLTKRVEQLLQPLTEALKP
jgi:membrane-associated phospholipid phosphatase